MSAVASMGPFKHGMAWVAYRITSSVLDDIWPGVLFFTSVAVMVCCVSEFTSVDLGINSVMLTVLGTIVSLVVSFKTNNSYSRWWDGRNGWANLTSACRQMAMLIWLHVPNALPPKPDETPTSAPKADSPPTPEATPLTKISDPFQSTSPSNKPSSNTFKTAAESIHTNDTSVCSNESELRDNIGYNWKEHKEQEQRKARKNDDAKARDDPQSRAELAGLIEKKSYIGLVQAFAVAMKHALRGETGPFYSDLYSLIAFLPKYNPSCYPPITRDKLFALWNNGIPRQKSSKATDDIAVPLTVPVAFRQDALNQPNLPNPFFEEEMTDIEKGEFTGNVGLSEFKDQAIKSASAYVATDDPEVFVVTSKRDGRHSIQQRRSISATHDSRGPHSSRRYHQCAEQEQVTLETVELMPPRHPPPPKLRDFLPPLRLIKSIWDKLNWKKKQQQTDSRRRRKRRRMGTDMEIPQEILMYISAYCADVARRGLVGPSYISVLAAPLLDLQRAISDMEKIATTPIPSAYTFHLRLTVYAYLMFIPFQVYKFIGWVTIPATAIAAIIYLGFLEIGMQIEMPFNYDQSDLDLDEFVLRISHQIAQLTAFPNHIPSSQVVLSHLNQPFLPTLRTSATELLGVPDYSPGPSARGFAASFADAKTKEDENPVTKPMMKSMRDIELVLNANWKDITSDAKNIIGKPRDQLENRTGLEVAVLTL
nr:hypothetical protein L204_06205 [Cryptococcus depauperatus CBS 7855]